ncbi:MAG: D-alanyl-D-alanine carboxypeptidase [Ruminococcaceae bacterium]|nr:D-alanyl-D-alanine carboxypeptidase [Oscillospiraceae bacterium]
MKKKMIALLLCALMAFPCSVQAGYWQEPEQPQTVAVSADTGGTLNLDCRSAILMEPLTGKVLYEHNPDQRLPEASITKVMTVLLVLEALDSGRIGWDDTVTCSAHAASMGGSQIWLEEGERMSVRELLKATMVSSANDASVALAEHVAGSHESFVALMNQRAAELGLEGTAYKNCTGLDAEGHLTTARDIALASAELMRHQEVFEFSTIWMDSLRNGQLQMTNTNKLIRTYSGITGLKTGTTSQAGCCVAATAERDGMPLIAVVLGAPNSKTRFADAARLLDYGFANYSLLDLSTLTADTPSVTVVRGMEKELPTCVDLSGWALVPKGRGGEVQITVAVSPDVAAPVEIGQTVGAVTLTLDEQTIGEYDIVTTCGTDAITFGNVFGLMWEGLTG